jgi:hypothetical protein
MCHMALPLYFSRFYRAKNNYWIEKSMKPLVMQFLSVVCFFSNLDPNTLFNTLFSKTSVYARPLICDTMAHTRIQRQANYTSNYYNFLFNILCPCIVIIIPNYNQQDASFLDLFISTGALHVSGGSSAHHQEHITVHTASGIVSQYCC